MAKEREIEIIRLKEQELYKEIIELYNSFILQSAKFIKSFDLPKSPLAYSILISNLIKQGVFSYNNTFSVDSTLNNELSSCRGLKIVLGYGCCRNISIFHKEIFDTLDQYSKEFFCYASKIRFFTKNKEANHVINLIQTEEGLYGYDVFSNMLFRFINDTQLISVSNFYTAFLTYKPEFEYYFYQTSDEEIIKNIELFKHNSSNSLLYDEYIDTKVLVDKVYKKQLSLSSDFENETEDIKKRIKSLNNNYKRNT